MTCMRHNNSRISKEVSGNLQQCNGMLGVEKPRMDKELNVEDLSRSFCIPAAHSTAAGGSLLHMESDMLDFE